MLFYFSPKGGWPSGLIPLIDRSPLTSSDTSGVIVLVAAAVEAEEVGHDSRAGVAGVVEAGQPERGFHRLQQREMRVVIPTA